MSGNISEDDFCNRFSSFSYMAALGNDPFRTAFIVNAVLNVPFCITATVTNALVIISIWHSYSLWTPANMLLISLAMSDLGVGLILQPLYIAYLISFAERGVKESTCTMSVAVAVTASIFSCVSFGTVTAISLERYLSLRLHLRCEDVITLKRVRRFLVILWLLGAISPLIWVMFAPSYRSYFFVSGIMFCLVISTAAYINIYRIACVHLKRIEALRHEVDKKSKNLMLQHRRKRALNMFLVYCVLLCCYLPYSLCLALGKIMGYTEWNWIAINFTLTIININSSINPLIYCYRMREIRRAILLTVYSVTFGRTNMRQITS